LSGRTLHGLGSYWFELLDDLVRVRGTREVAQLLKLDGDRPLELALGCVGDPRRQRIIQSVSSNQSSRHLEPKHITTLAQAGMTVGFHTLHHLLLTQLPESSLRRALVDGRDELAAVVGLPLDLLAYPHGKADGRVARYAREAGYAAAWTGAPEPMRSGNDPYLLGRWEPGRLGIDDFLTKITIRLKPLHAFWCKALPRPGAQ
jgi:peptidoglycan/xylan/chitin deacetylase (PgdA/CDA1 family)